MPHERANIHLNRVQYQGWFFIIKICFDNVETLVLCDFPLPNLGSFGGLPSQTLTVWAFSLSHIGFRLLGSAGSWGGRFRTYRAVPDVNGGLEVLQVAKVAGVEVKVSVMQLCARYCRSFFPIAGFREHSQKPGCHRGALDRVGVVYGCMSASLGWNENWSSGRNEDPRPSGNPLNLQEMISTALERRLARYFCQVHLGLGSKPSWSVSEYGIVFWTFSTSRLPNPVNSFSYPFLPFNVMKKGRSIWSKAWSRWPMGQNLWDAYQVEIIFLHVELSENLLDFDLLVKCFWSRWKA